MVVLRFILICDLIVIVNVSSNCPSARESAPSWEWFMQFEKRSVLIRFLPLVIIHSAKTTNPPLSNKTDEWIMTVVVKFLAEPNKFQSWRWRFQCVCCLHCTMCSVHCTMCNVYCPMCSVAKTYTTIAGQSIQSVPYLNRDLTYTNWDKNAYFAWFIGHKERQKTADFTSD